MSKAAMQGECGNLKIRKTKEYLALVPFFGGLPPGVTKDFSKVGVIVSLSEPFLHLQLPRSALCALE